MTDSTNIFQFFNKSAILLDYLHHSYFQAIFFMFIFSEKKLKIKKEPSKMLNTI